VGFSEAHPPCHLPWASLHHGRTVEGRTSPPRNRLGSQQTEPRARPPWHTTTKAFELRQPTSSSLRSRWHLRIHELEPPDCTAPSELEDAETASLSYQTAPPTELTCTCDPPPTRTWARGRVGRVGGGRRGVGDDRGRHPRADANDAGDRTPTEETEVCSVPGISEDRGDLNIVRIFTLGMKPTPAAPHPSILLTDKRRNHLRFASVQTYTFFTMVSPRFLSNRGARGLQAFDIPLLTNYLNPIYDETRKRLHYIREND
jgi:hypothetical protein